MAGNIHSFVAGVYSIGTHLQNVTYVNVKTGLSLQYEKKLKKRIKLCQV